MICILDMEKAFDHVLWECLLEILERKGFNARWCTWICWCMSTSSFSVMTNGLASGGFEVIYGLETGDSLCCSWSC